MEERSADIYQGMTDFYDLSIGLLGKNKTLGYT